MSHKDRRDEEDALEEVLAEYIDRLNRGEMLDENQVLAECPDIGIELWKRLEIFQTVGARARTEEALGTLGDYTLRRQIGRGGMGVVYEAWENSMDRRVALKVLPAGVAADDRAFQRFMREARTAGKLSHPNVVPVHAMGQVENTPYFAMEFLEGETLAQILARIRGAEPDIETPFGKRSEQQFYLNVAKAVADVADGLQHAHSRGVTHRDIKPSNLILDADGRLRILDFGLARLEGQESITLSGDFIGTPLYMSPEQARRKKIPVDHRTDIYSLGATVYEAICGRPPFRGKDHADTLSQIIERDPTGPCRVNPRVPRNLETIVLKCLRKSSGDRYGTAEALGQDLRRFVRGDPVEAIPEASWQRSMRRIWRQRVLLGVLCLVVLLASSVAALLYDWRHRAHERLRSDYNRGLLEAALTIEYSKFSPAGSTGKARAIDPAGFFSLPPRIAGGMNSVPVVMDRLRTLAKTLPNEPDAYYSLASALAVGGEFEKALQQLDESLARDQQYAPAIALKAAILGRLGQEDAATALFANSRGHENRRVEALVAACAAEARTDWIGAANAYDRYIDGTDGVSNPRVDLTLRPLLGRGLARLRAGQYGLAIGDFSIASHLYRKALEPVLLLGQAWLERGGADDVAEAEEIFLRFQDRTESSRQDAVALAIVSVYSSVGERDKALQWAVERIQDATLRDRTRAALLVHFRPLEGALAAKNAIEGDPSDALAHVWIAWAQLSRGAEETARGHLDEALRLDPENGLALWWLGYQQVQAGDLDVGIESLKHAAARIDTPHVSTCLAEAFALKGLEADADSQFHRSFDLLGRYFSRALRRDRGHPAERMARTGYARFLWKQQRFDEMLAEYADSLTARTGTKWVERDVLLSRALLDNDVVLPRQGLNRMIKAFETRLPHIDAVPQAYLVTLAQLLFHRRQEDDPLMALEYARSALEKSGPDAGFVPLILAEIESSVLGPSASILTLERALSDGIDDPRVALELNRYRKNAFPIIPSCDSIDSLVEEGLIDELVPEKATWRFFRGQREPSPNTEWTSVEFSDNDWEKGRAAFGYGLTVPDYSTELHDMVGKHTTLYVRRRFELNDPTSYSKIYLTVRTDDGFVGYLNGTEIARVHAGSPGRRVPHNGSATAQCRNKREVPFYRTVLRPGTLRKGSNCLAIQGLNHSERGQNLFYLDATLVGMTHRDLSWEHLLAELRRTAERDAACALASYLEGRLLLRAERLGDATLAFRTAIKADPNSPEPHRRLAECLRAAGSSEQSEESLRRVLGDFPDDRKIWNLWHEIAALDLELSPGAILENLGSAPSGGYGSDMAWLLRTLVNDGVVRINCGESKDTRAEDGSFWGRDRFYSGGRPTGKPYFGEIEVIGGGARVQTYRRARRFAPGTLLPPCYSFPVPRGRYRLTLMFAEVLFLPPVRRRFSVFVEGRPVLPDHEAPEAAIGTVKGEAITLDGVTVTDGFLDVEFAHQLCEPTISGIEIERLP